LHRGERLVRVRVRVRVKVRVRVRVRVRVMASALCGAIGSRCLPESLYRRMCTITSSPGLRLKPTTEPRSCSM